METTKTKSASRLVRQPPRKDYDLKHLAWAARARRRGLSWKEIVVHLAARGIAIRRTSLYKLLLRRQFRLEAVAPKEKVPGCGHHCRRTTQLHKAVADSMLPEAINTKSRSSPAHSPAAPPTFNYGIKLSNQVRAQHHPTDPEAGVMLREAEKQLREGTW